MSVVTEALSAEFFQEFVLQHDKTVVFFWAAWSEPCKALDAIIAELMKGHNVASFIKVEAEKVPDVSGHLRVKAVPTFVFLYKGDEVDRLEGFDPAALYAKAAAHASYTKGTLEDRLSKLISSQPVMLFMKGTPDMPRCGFSRKVVEALRQDDIAFGSFDILTDEEVRQGLKKLSDWPTYPQLYAGGELLGGCDIVLEMHQGGELRTSIEEALKEAGMELPNTDNKVQTRIKELLHKHPVMLFMKGSPDAPRCGFSRRVVEALNAINQPFQHFDILTDEEIRQGLKKYSDWPTYPQLFVMDEMIGGCDIVEELAKTGDLRSTIDAAMEEGKKKLNG